MPIWCTSVLGFLIFKSWHLCALIDQLEGSFKENVEPKAEVQDGFKRLAIYFKPLKIIYYISGSLCTNIIFFLYLLLVLC